MVENTYQIAIIIVNYNSSRYTINCIQSIIEQTAARIHYQIVVIDNNSRPEEYEALTQIQAHKQVHLFRSRINLGFSGGNMLGVQYANARYYYFLNNDCILLNDCLSILYTYCEKHPQTGICSGQMFDENLKQQPTFDYFPTLRTKLLGIGLLRQMNPAKYPVKKITYEQPLKVDLLSGSSLFIRSSVFDSIGGFDTTYFLYCEEEDIALTLLKQGYHTYLVPEARYQHLGGKSTQYNLMIQKEFYISFLYFYKKHYGRFKTTIMQGFLFMKLIRKLARHRNYPKLAFFVLSGAPLYKSLKYLQKVN
jgi:GT2 family glycosyltransferase